MDTDIIVKKMEPSLVEDFFLFFDKIAFAVHPEWGCECYCCFFHAMSEQEWKDRTVQDNQVIARRMILAGDMQGLLAYLDNKPVGWCHYDQKDKLPGIRVFYPEAYGPGDPSRIGSIVCFTVAQNYRRRGVASVLLEKACQDLAKQGCRIAEVYPIKDNQQDEYNYLGPTSMFVKHGFTVYRDLQGQLIMRKTLDKV
jgi:ribosomal protein S18 acetylase RimI-like enzyme